MHFFEAIRTTIEILKHQRDKLRQELNDVESAISYQESLLKNPPLNGNVVESEKQEESSEHLPTPILTGSIKPTILLILDEVRQPIKMSDLQQQYQNKTNKELPIREYARSLNKQGLLKIMKLNGSNRNSFWVKSDWIHNGKLKNEYKWEGFDNIYSDADIVFV